MGLILAGLLIWTLWVLLALVPITMAALLIYARWHYGKLEKLGIPVVKPHFFLGSTPNGHNEVLNFVDLERFKTYGPVYGVYEGRMPTVFVSDPRILRIIQTRDFEYFKSHRQFLEIEHPMLAELLDFLDDDKWRTIRSALTPHFTSGKIKQMCDTISDVSEEYITAFLEENKGEDVIPMNIRDYIPPLVFEIIGKCFCGINIESARDPNNEMIKILKASMGGEAITFASTFTLFNAFPFLTKLVPMFPTGALNSFEAMIRSILKGREDSKIVKPDMVNTLLEIFQKSRTDPNYKRLGITETTALAQSFEFFIASYLALRSTFAIITYYLAVNSDIQERLLKEVDAALEKHPGRVTSDTVADMPYLTGVIYETLRIQPGFYRPDRKCTKDWEYNGIKIKKDMNVIISLWPLHRDPTQYPDPEKFDPERFLPGRKEQIDTYAFNTFGQGPRACIGQRFAYEMLKIVSVQYLKEFKMERRADTVLRIRPGNPLFTTYDPILINFVRRK